MTARRRGARTIVRARRVPAKHGRASLRSALARLYDTLDETRRWQGARWLQVNCALFPQGPGQPVYLPWRELSDALDRWRAEERFRRSFFMLKPPGLRLRFFGEELGARLEPPLVEWLERAEHRNDIRGFRIAVYEPEVFRFGGPAGMDIAHEQFDRDSRIAMRYAALPPADRERLPTALFSVAVTSDLLARCVDDRAEAWDIWQRLARAVGGTTAPAAGDTSTLEQVREAAFATAAFARRVTPAGVALIEEARAANAHIAARLHGALVAGHLWVGARAWLAAVCIFHWNRLGLTTADLAPVAADMSRLLQPDEGGP